MNIPISLRSAVRQTTDLLAAKKYHELAALTGGVRLSADQIELAVSQYGTELVTLPDAGYAAVDVVEVGGSVPRAWSVYVPLWSREEGRSDLTLCLAVIDGGKSATPTIELDSLRVL